MMTQQTRYVLALVAAYGGWTTALGLTFIRAQHDLPVWAGTIIVVLVGIAIAAGIALSRMRLQRTLTDVFTAGMQAAKIERENVVAELERREREMKEPK